MTLQASGAISINDIAVELGISNAGLSLNDGRVRGMAGLSSGAISLSNLYGKSNFTTITASTYNTVNTGFDRGVGGSIAYGSFSGVVSGFSLPPIVNLAALSNNSSANATFLALTASSTLNINSFSTLSVVGPGVNFTVNASSALFSYDPNFIKGTWEFDGAFGAFNVGSVYTLTLH